MEDKRQSVEVQLPAQMPPVWADRTRMAQVLINLVSNAYKYTPEGGSILIGAEATENQWDPEGARHVAHLWVKDNGIGINFEDQSGSSSASFAPRTRRPAKRQAQAWD